MEHELSAAMPSIAHGAGLAVLTPAWMRHVAKKEKGMFVQFAVNVMGVAYDRDEDAVIEEGIDRFAKHLKALGPAFDTRGAWDEQSGYSRHGPPRRH